MIAVINILCPHNKTNTVLLIFKARSSGLPLLLPDVGKLSDNQIRAQNAGNTLSSLGTHHQEHQRPYKAFVYQRDVVMKRAEQCSRLMPLVTFHCINNAGTPTERVEPCYGIATLTL